MAKALKNLTIFRTSFMHLILRLANNILVTSWPERLPGGVNACMLQYTIQKFDAL